MKNIKELPKYKADRLNNITFIYLESKLLYEGIELKIFNYLEEERSLEDLNKILNLDERNLELFLKALVSMDYLTYRNKMFKNTEESNYFLNEKSDMYLGENILYWKDMTNIDNLSDLLKKGSNLESVNENNGSDFFDFRSMGKGAQNSMYLGRVQNFISLIEKLFDKDKNIKVLDLGCGSGILSIEIAKNFPNATCKLIDQEEVIKFTKEVIIENEVEDRVVAKVGDFNEIEIDEEYDLIVASGILDFVKDINQINKKIFKGLKDDGYLYISTHQMNEDFTQPKNFILGWLSSNLNGLDILKPEKDITDSLYENKLEEVIIENHPRTIYKRMIINE